MGLCLYLYDLRESPEKCPECGAVIQHTGGGNQCNLTMASPAMGIIVFVVLGGAFGLGIGVIIGYMLGERAGVRKAQRGFPITQVNPPGPPQQP